MTDLARAYRAGAVDRAVDGQANKGAVTHGGAAEWPWFDR
jgi:hypothetical protein